MYLEGMNDDIYERADAKWQENGKKGPRPNPPEGYYDRKFNTPENAHLEKDSSGRPIPQDIGDMFEM